MWKRFVKRGPFECSQGRNSSKYVDVRLDDQVIRKLESIKQRIQSRKKNADTGFSAEDKTLIMQVKSWIQLMVFQFLSSVDRQGMTQCLACIMLQWLISAVLIIHFVDVDEQCMQLASSLSSRSLEKCTAGWTRKP